MDVVTLTPADADATVALWGACNLTRPWNDAHADYARALAGPSSTVLGVRDGEALVGTVMVGGDGHRGWVYYLAADPGRRGEGIGRALMAAAEGWLVAHDLPKVQFMVRTANTEVLTFYARLGYEEQDVVVLGRRLDAPAH
ncbi:GNAT family acetyltransferase [Propioniciclava soli]|uniref:GNAT family acetyltransferase n=1 Tax=Propioniciclava soli TaxID=2775081 RepID=A0ABZ3C537_9ACTN|nr:GNAT family acetyltransferase [Propioniciclava soli]